MQSDRKAERITARELIPLAVLILLTVLILVAILFGERGGGERKEKHFSGYFDTVSTVYDYSGGENDFDAVCALVSEKLGYYHSLFDIYEDHEGVVSVRDINLSAGDGPIGISEELCDFLAFCKELYYKTNGEVNIAMGSVLSIWHEYRDTGTDIPDYSLLLDAAAHTNIENLIIDRDALTAEISDPALSLDVGAVAKGYATERIAEALSSAGYTGIALDIGGNLRVIGAKADGSGWRTGVRNPDSDSGERYVYYLDIADTSVVTSGDYERFYTVDGKRYHHIIDEDTLMPSEYFSSVTVQTQDSGIADALSTALFSVDIEKGRAIAESFGVEKVIWVGRDGELTVYEK